MKFDATEGAACHAVLTRSADQAASLEALLAALLDAAAGRGPRATDGLVLLREQLTDTSYFAVGRVYLIEDQTAEPVCIDLAFDARVERIASGSVRFGCSAQGHQSRKGEKLENRLLAYPRETAADLDWMYVFERSANGWHLKSGPQYKQDAADEPRLE